MDGALGKQEKISRQCAENVGWLDESCKPAYIRGHRWGSSKGSKRGVAGPSPAYNKGGGEYE